MSSHQSQTIFDTWRLGGDPLRIRVAGRSMLPLLRPGDLVELRPCVVAALRPGDIVVVVADAALLTHRLLRADPDRLLLRGDAMPAPDSPVANEALLGLVVARLRAGRRISLRRPLALALGRAMAHFSARGSRALVRRALALAATRHSPEEVDHV